MCLREDDVFKGEVYSVAHKVIVSDLMLYCYVQSSSQSSTHNQSIERQRLLIRSGLLAIKYRKELIAAHCPNQTFPYERLKYMRWVCSLRSAIEAEMTFEEYTALLDEFRQEGVYPLEYKWIRVAGFANAFKPFMKRVIKTFFVNHPHIGWPLAKWYYRK